MSFHSGPLTSKIKKKNKIKSINHSIERLHKNEIAVRKKKKKTIFMAALINKHNHQLHLRLLCKYLHAKTTSMYDVVKYTWVVDKHRHLKLFYRHPL